MLELEGSPHFLKDQEPASVPIWLEALAGLDWLALRLSPVYYGYGVPPGDGSPVVIVPGFLGTDHYLQELYWWLRRIGYRPYMSRIGQNADCMDLLVARLFTTIEEAHAATGQRVHLVGHSLGGMLSRSAAAQRSDLIASVTALGSPFRGIRSHPLVLHVSDRVRTQIQRRLRAENGGEGDRPHCFTGHCTCATVRAFQNCVPDPIASMAIYTRTDGITDWRYCLNDDPTTNFEVTGTHVGLAFNPQVYDLIAAQLAAVGAVTRSAA